MIGGAAGDALGYTVEFDRYEEIIRQYGRSGITEFEPDPVDGTAHISDDTQMSLFTAAGLLTGRAMNVALGYPEHIWRAYKDWYNAQSGEGVEADETVFGSTWLYRVPALNNPRAPGMTCMSVLSSGRKGSIKDPVNDSKGCGGVMRAAPVGLFFEPGAELSAEEIDLLGAESGALTHGHPLGWLTCALLTRIISTITYGDTEKYCIPSRKESRSSASGSENGLERIIRDSVKAFRDEFTSIEPEFTEQLCGIISSAIELARSCPDDIDAVRKLGEGWVAEETLAIAVYCSVKYCNDFKKCLIAAVNHDGDSDSTGAVAGNILGAYLGEEGIPAEYREKLEILNIITEIADDLYDVYKPVDDFMWTAKYIMANYKM